MIAKLKLDPKSAIVGAVLGITVALSVAANKTTDVPVERAGSEESVSWEYKTVDGRVFQGRLEREINEAAADGWEFVTASEFGVDHMAFAVMRRERK